MKKIVVLLMCLVVVCASFAACSKTDTNGADNNSTASVKLVETEKAKIKENDALKFIETAYTKEELGLADTDKDYHFMIASSGVKIKNKKYVKIVANVPIKKDVTNANGQETFTMETLGEYYISFDGKKVLMKDMKTNEYTELENRYDAYSEKGETVSENKTTEKSATENNQTKNSKTEKKK